MVSYLAFAYPDSSQLPKIEPAMLLHELGYCGVIENLNIQFSFFLSIHLYDLLSKDSLLYRPYTSPLEKAFKFERIHLKEFLSFLTVSIERGIKRTFFGKKNKKIYLQNLQMDWSGRKIHNYMV